MKQETIQADSLQSGDYYLNFPEEINVIPKLIRQTYPKCSRFMLLMDNNINTLYGQIFNDQFKQISDCELYSFIINSGEKQKSMENIMKLLDQLFKYQFNRTDVLIGFGGGLVTDFGGFAASIYKRGIKYISIPTTILAMSDAAIGSKTGVNNQYGKNMIGSFYDPSLIIVCDKFLESLDDRNMSNGIAEVIKIAAMLDSDLFTLLEQNDVKSLRKNVSILRKIIRRSMELKISVVSQDKFEGDRRMILNYGHTIGHGIEFASKENLLHGECVSIGIILANELALFKQQTTWEYCQSIQKLLIQYNLPIEIPSFVHNEEILFYMGNDKKNRSNQSFQFVFVEDIGKVIYQTQPISSSEVLNILSLSVKIGSTEFSKLKDDIIVKLAGSKSVTNRALVFCALLNKETELENVLFAEDTEVMMNSLQKLGACSIQQIDHTRIKIKGNGGEFKFENEQEIYVNNSGTSARFLCSILLLLNPNQSVVIKCCERMKERPIKDLTDALSDFLNFQYLEKENYLPFRVTKKSDFNGGDIHINSKISSQFVTGILMASPFALNPTRVILSQEDKITSESFIEMTYRMMKQFSADIQRVQSNIFKIGNKKYLFQDDKYYIEPDAATASYDMAWAILNQKTVTIQGFNRLNSLQGDLKFTEKLIQLGYTIEFNDFEVVIRGDLKRLEETNNSFDFNDCTDTFITFCIIIATLDDNSGKPYKITNISNQRVKECDRIHAVCKNLKKFGIQTKELDDGLEIIPNRNLLLKQDNQKQFITIKCFKDHRIGMAFAQLAVFLNNNTNNSYEVRLDEGNCVNKTFPTFFQHLKQNYSVTCQKINNNQDKKKKIDNCGANTIFIIGMRCCGKSTLSQKMSKLLNMNYICLDKQIYTQFFSDKYQNLKEVIDSEGWDVFRSRELQILQQIVQENKTNKYMNTIISCGGGIVTIPEARDILKKQKYVIWLRRDLIEIEKDFQSRTEIPNYINTMKEDYDFRRGLYDQSASHIFNFPGYSFVSEFMGEKEYWGRIDKSFKNFIKCLFDEQTRNSGQNQYLYAEESHFLCMQMEDIKKLSFIDLVYIQRNYHALEIRGDLFFENHIDSSSLNSSKNLIQLEEFCSVISRVKLICHKLSLIFTLRTREEGGALQKQKHFYFQIINYMQRQCIFDYIDIEVDLLSKDHLQIFNQIQQKDALILSKHYLHIKEQHDNINDLLQKFKDLMRDQDILKIVLSSLTQPNELENIRREVLTISPKSIIIQLGKSGKLSRIQNNFLTPVYDAKFGPPTGQGQLQKSEISTLRNELNLTSTEKKFYIFGTDIKNSPSPLIHNTCFQQLNLHNYYFQIVQINTVDDIEPYLRHHEFGGATITMPFKQEVSKFVNYVIGDAKVIGIDFPVINTIVKLNSKLFAFNTDWYGILKPLKKQLTLNQHYLQSKEKYAFVIGAGATSMTMVYCLNILGFQTIMFNRTYSRIEKFINWNGVFKGFSDMEELIVYLNSNPNIQFSVIANTIPGKVDIQLRDELFTYKPTIFDASYIPQDTPLIQKAKQQGCTTFIYGLDMLLYQAYLQNYIFTGKRVSRKQIKNTTENVYKKLHSQLQ